MSETQELEAERDRVLAELDALARARAAIIRRRRWSWLRRLIGRA